MKGRGVDETVAERIARMILEDAASGWELDDGCLEHPGILRKIDFFEPDLWTGGDDLDSETLSWFSSLLFPGLSLQRRLEPVLLRERLSGRDVERIGSIIEAAEWTVWLSRGAQRWRWRPHASLIPVYLERFHMTWRIDRTLLRRIVRVAGKREWQAVMVRLRNRRFPKTRLQSQLVQTFFEEADVRRLDSCGWMYVIDFLIESIAEEPPFSNVWEVIEDRRQFWIRMYDQTVASEVRRRQFPMETWMMAKTPMGVLMKEETIGKIEACERVLSMRKNRQE